MPLGKKKRNSESGKKKGKKTEKKLIVEPPPPEQPHEETAEFYMTQIRDLECKFERYQKKCHELELKNGEYLEKFDELFKKKKNEVFRVKKILDEKTDEIAEANERLIGLQQAKDLDKERFEQQLQQLRIEYQETKDHLTSENLVLGGKLASLEEFKTQRDEIIAKVNALEHELYEQDCLHTENICAIEKKQVSDKERLKKEMGQRINSVAAEFRKVSNQRMPETTKRMIRENAAICAQMSKVTDRTTKMVEESDGLKERERQRRKRIGILEANERELAWKSVSSHRIVQMLMEKSNIQEKAIVGFGSRDEQGKLYMEAEIDQLRQQLSSARAEYLSVGERNKELEKELGESRATLDEWMLLQQRLEKTVLEAIFALQVVFHDTAGEDSSELSSAIRSKRQVVVCNLIHLMNRAVALERGHDVGGSQGGPDVACGEYSRIASDHSGSYRVVDQPNGRNSRPERHIPANLGAFKRAGHRSIGTQTDGTAKALLLANQLIMRLPTARENFCPSRNSTMSPTRRFLPQVVPVASNNGFSPIS